MNRSLTLVAVFALLPVAVTPVNAGLIGSTVNSTYYFPNLGSPVEDDGTQTVAPTASFDVFGGYITETITDTQITIFDPSNYTGSAFNGPVFDFINSGNLLTGATLNGNIPGFGASRVSVLPDGAGGQLLEINLQGLPVGLTITLNVSTTAPAPPPILAPAPLAPDPPTIPEPTGIALFAIVTASGAIFGWYRKRQKR